MKQVKRFKREHELFRKFSNEFDYFLGRQNTNSETDTQFILNFCDFKIEDKPQKYYFY